MTKVGVRTDLINALNDIISNASPPEEIAYYLSKFKPNKHEVKQVLDINMSRLGRETKRVLEDYLNRMLTDDDIITCYLCKGKILPTKITKANFIFQDDNFNKTYEKNICKKCYNKLKGGKLNYKFCRYHVAFFDSSVEVKCGLFDKCHPKDTCPNPQCLELHYRNVHSKYHKRKWKPAKKYIGGNTGEIITSELPVGIEFEIIGKDDGATRKNIFKLDKNIGIGTDASINGFIYPTEIQTPPASLRKLERMTQEVCDSVIEDGMIINNKCGNHIHIGTYNLYGSITKNPDFYRSLLYGYIIFEKFFRFSVPITRQHNPNVRWLDNHKSYMLNNWNNYPTSKFSHFWYMNNNDTSIGIMRKDQRGNGTKYIWANFHSLFQSMGLEIRLLEASLNPKTTLNWISFNQKFIDGIASLTEPLYKTGKMFLSAPSQTNDYYHIKTLFANKEVPTIPAHLGAKYKLFTEILRKGSRNEKDYNRVMKFLNERIANYETTYMSSPYLPQISGIAQVDSEFFSQSSPIVNKVNERLVTILGNPLASGEQALLETFLDTIRSRDNTFLESIRNFYRAHASNLCTSIQEGDDENFVIAMVSIERAENITERIGITSLMLIMKVIDKYLEYSFLREEETVNGLAGRTNALDAMIREQRQAGTVSSRVSTEVDMPTLTPGNLSSREWGSSSETSNPF